MLELFFCIFLYITWDKKQPFFGKKKLKQKKGTIILQTQNWDILQF